MNDEQKRNFRSWDKFLNPDILKENLIAISLFIATYEILCTSVVERIKSFFTNGYSDGIPTISQDYETKVLSLNKSPFLASQIWLKEMAAIDNNDMLLIHKIRDHRNALAHELLDFLTVADVEVNINLMAEIYRLVSKIDRWWIQEVELPTNPEYDGQEIADDDIMPGPMVCIQVMLRLVTGKDASELWHLWQAYHENSVASSAS